MDTLTPDAAASDADLQEELRGNPRTTALDLSNSSGLTYLSLKTIRELSPSLLTLKLCRSISVHNPPRVM